MSAIRSWRALLRIKERRLAQQEQAVQAARDEVVDCQRGLLQAQQAEAQRVDEWQQARHRVSGMLVGDDPFKPELLLLRRHQVDDREQACRRARGDTERHQQRVRVAVHELQTAQALLQRMEHQQKLAREALDKALRTQEQTQEDQQDEEAEETAVARLLAATRHRTGEARGTRV